MKKSGVLLIFVAMVSLFVAQTSAQPMCLPSNWCWENPLPQGNTLNGIWNIGQDVYTVGVGGTILHYDGNEWTKMYSPTTAMLTAIWGASGSQIYAVGKEGTILHFDGATWGMQSSGTSDHLGGLWGAAENDVWAVGDGGGVLHYDGDCWTSVSSGTTQSLHAIWGSGPQDL